MFWIVLALVVVGALALGWWSSGRMSSALRIDAAEQTKSSGQLYANQQQTFQGGGGS